MTTDTPDPRDFVREPLAALREVLEAIDESDGFFVPGPVSVVLDDAKKTLDAYAADAAGMIHVETLKADITRLKTELARRTDSHDRDGKALMRYAAERDAITTLCYERLTPPGEDPYYRLKIDPACELGVTDYDFDTEAEAVVAVRKCAGLKGSTP